MASNANSPPVLLDLPQEIQDMIFDYAYPHTGRHCIAPIEKIHDEGEDEKTILRGQCQCSGTLVYPDLKVDEFLVSKEYFVAAARAYVRNQRFRAEFACSQEFGPNYQSGYGGVIAAWATRLSIFDRDIFLEGWQIDFFPKLRDLRVFVMYTHAKNVEGWLLDLIDEIESTSVFQALVKISGLSKFSITSKDEFVEEEEQVAWIENLRRLEALLMPHVTKPKDAVIIADQPTQLSCRPLYKFSAVCFGTSQIGQFVNGVTNDS